MLFESASQFQKAKKTLLENNRDVNKSASILIKSPMFSDLSEGELISQLTELNEGLGDNIMNFLSNAFGGDISKLKTVLTQMKEQELKFNREEFQIWEEFYRLLEDQKALDKNRNNPDYQYLNKELQQSRNGLNLRLKELTKTHNEIFDALEQKVRDLTKDSNRKKAYFNAQRASDVLETRSDRYEKIKAITARSSARSEELEKFFNVSVEDLEKEREDAEKKAKTQEEKLRKQSTETSENPHETSNDPELLPKMYKERIKEILSFPADVHFTNMKKLRDLQKEIVDVVQDNKKTVTPENPFGDLGEGVHNELVKIAGELNKKIEELVRKKDKVTAEEAVEAAKKITTRKR